MSEMFESLMFAARREIVVTTPYYVPDDSLQTALCTTAYRGVDTTIVFPDQKRLLDLLVQPAAVTTPTCLLPESQESTSTRAPAAQRNRSRWTARSP